MDSNGTYGGQARVYMNILMSIYEGWIRVPNEGKGTVPLKGRLSWVKKHWLASSSSPSSGAACKMHRAKAAGDATRKSMASAGGMQRSISPALLSQTASAKPLVYRKSRTCECDVRGVGERERGICKGGGGRVLLVRDMCLCVLRGSRQ